MLFQVICPNCLKGIQCETPAGTPLAQVFSDPKSPVSLHRQTCRGEWDASANPMTEAEAEAEADRTLNRYLSNL